MPKNRRSRSVSFDRPSPFPLSNPPRSPLPLSTDSQQWDQILCPVCMEHPHNAVLLLCSSHDKGCRPFICDTSYRHSNCLDQYQKAIKSSLPDDSKTNLSCPLCRGAVSGSKVVEPARKHMNSKPRSCSTESCGFYGTYGDLRKHARTDHPLVRPSDSDPDRERDWRNLERERDLGDLISTMRSAFGEEEEGGVEFGGLMPFTTITFFLVLRFRGSGRSARNWRRGRVLWGESIVDGDDDGGDVDGDDDGDDDGNDVA